MYNNYKQVCNTLNQMLTLIYMMISVTSECLTSSRTNKKLSCLKITLHGFYKIRKNILQLFFSKEKNNFQSKSSNSKQSVSLKFLT